MKTRAILSLAVLLTLLSCRQDGPYISMEVADRAIESICAASSDVDKAMVTRGVSQMAGLWTEDDGSPDEFVRFAVEKYKAGSTERKILFDKLSRAFEILAGGLNGMTVELQKPVVLSDGTPDETDYSIAGFDLYSHYSDDMFDSRIAFMTMLNFPFFTLEEKNTLGKQWSRLEWAYARMGDMFTTRTPSEVSAELTRATSEAENYIAEYNIMMGHLLDSTGRRIFPQDMALLSHWNLRDEIKSDYSGGKDSHEKQEMIYKVMERIVYQDIPSEVINNPEYDWNPWTNEVFKDGEKVDMPCEGDVRYRHILDEFKAELEADRYNPSMPTALARNFESGLEVSENEVTGLFTSLLESEQVQDVARIIKHRLGRDLRPYDIWYDGFKSRSTMSEDKLTEQTKALYPDADSYRRDIPRMLRQTGFSAEKADMIASHIEVQGARGSGHAWESQSRTQPALLRTRIGGDGLDYKGYNIAVHEMGHNVENILSLYDVDYYMLKGIPNNGFTEAMAFLFQMRDLQLLGYGDFKMDPEAVLDYFWGMYEIMGVALVDIYTWQWLYANRTATAEELRDQVIGISKDVWNRYYEKALGSHDSPVLAIYSHMVNYPLYLAYYPFGHIIHFQIEKHLENCGTSKEFADEIQRMYTLGRLTPDEWMNQAVGCGISVQPVLDAVSAAASILNEN